MTSPIDLASYLTKERLLEDEGLEEGDEGEGASNTSEEDWFEKAASDFLAQGASDPVFDAILEATKVFTRKNFALRAGHLYRQQLQNIPSYELVCTLEKKLVELAGEANWLAANTPLDNTHYLGSAAYQEQELVASEWKAKEAAHKSAVIQWAYETLMPKLEGTNVIKVTRSTKKANKAMLAVPAATLIAMSLEYKALIEQFIKPGTFLPKLTAGAAWKETMKVLSAKSGKEISGHALYNILWSKKEQDQWIYGLLEYANALLAVVTYAQSRDPNLAPRKYLCYFQKKSEATLYRGQDELDAMVATMRADNMLSAPLYTNEPKPEWETQYHNPRLEDSEEAEGSVTANTSSVPSATPSAPSAPLTLSQKLAAKRAAKSNA